MVVDFAPHHLEFLRQDHAHRRLGFSDLEMGRWFEEAGVEVGRTISLSPDDPSKALTVKIWMGQSQSRRSLKLVEAS